VSLQKLNDRIRKNLEHFGIRETIYDVFLRGINCVVFFKVFKAMSLERVDPEYLIIEPPFEWRQLDRMELEEFAHRPEYDMPQEFLDSAIEKGDECFGVVVDDVLASYGWYSRQPTETSDDLIVSFNSAYVYMYKGFTHPQYRGQRLHAIGMNLALREYLNRGCRGLVSYVESNNFSSLKSVYRLGYRGIGSIAAWKVFGQTLVVASRKCRDFGFCFVPAKATLQTEALSSDSPEPVEAA
jgi:hypothetical protein